MAANTLAVLIRSLALRNRLGVLVGFIGNEEFLAERVQFTFQQISSVEGFGHL